MPRKGQVTTNGSNSESSTKHIVIELVSFLLLVVSFSYLLVLSSRKGLHSTLMYTPSFCALYYLPSALGRREGELEEPV